MVAQKILRRILGDKIGRSNEDAAFNTMANKMYKKDWNELNDRQQQTIIKLYNKLNR